MQNEKGKTKYQGRGGGRKVWKKLIFENDMPFSICESWLPLIYDSFEEIQMFAESGTFDEELIVKSRVNNQPILLLNGIPIPLRVARWIVSNRSLVVSELHRLHASKIAHILKHYNRELL